MVANGFDVEADRAAISSLVSTFFSSFESGPGSADRLAALRDLFVPGAVIVRACGGEPTVYDVDTFIEPRVALLSGGSLVDFTEWAEDGRTDVFGDVAQHLTVYGKRGVQDGVPFEARGMKTIQLVRTGAGWRIAAAAWDDEREGLVIRTAGRALASGAAPATGPR